MNPPAPVDRPHESGMARSRGGWRDPMWILLAAGVAPLAYLIWCSRGWLLIHDAPLMHYIAAQMNRGAVPYRDMFDMNLPGAYLLHLAVIVLGGPGDVAWRVFDLIWLAATMALLWAYSRPYSHGIGAAAGAVLFALYHLSGGAWHAGERDYLLCLFLLAGAFGVARGVERSGDARSLFAGGLAIGLGMTVKPYAGLFWILCGTFAALDGKKTGRGAIRAGLLVLAGGIVAPTLIVAWLAWIGGLRPFWAILADYVLPLYSQLDHVSVIAATAEHAYGRQVLGGLTVLALLGLPAARDAWSPRIVLAAAGVLSGAAHFGLQHKGWEYQLYPLIIFLCALAPGIASAGAVAARLRGLAPTAWAVLIVVLCLKGWDARRLKWLDEKAQRVDGITSALAPLVHPGDTVQVLDTSSGGIHALLRLGLRQPTRFIYDFLYYDHAEDPRVRAFRTELLEGLATGQPAAIVMLETSRPLKARALGFGRLSLFPELGQVLERDFILAATGSGYRIYAKRRHQ